MESTLSKCSGACGAEAPFLTRLPIPVPPSMEAALGYRGIERFVGFWFYQGGVHIEDRIAAFNRPAFSVFGLRLLINHPAMVAMTREHGFQVGPDGLNGGVASHGFIFDRMDRCLHVGCTKSLSDFLRPAVHGEDSRGPVLTGACPTLASAITTELIQQWITSTLDPFWVLVQDGLRRAGPTVA